MLAALRAVLRCGGPRDSIGAQARLLQSDEPPVAIASEAGFASLQHFSGSFLWLVGVSPSACRARGEAAGARRESIDRVNARRLTGDLEDIWRRFDTMEARLTAPLSARMLDLAGIVPGMRVLDLATGRGEPAIAAAHRVGAGGYVLGVDVSAAALTMARERASREGVTCLDLRAMDAAAPGGLPADGFQVALARWGLMYMTSPADALAAARRAMVPGGVFVAAVWAEPERVPYVTLPRRVLERLCPLPPLDLDAPGTFRYADPARLALDLRRAGFRVEHEEDFDLPVMEAETAAEVVAWTRAFGMARLLDGLPEGTQRAWESDMAREAEALRRDGYIRLGGVSRVVVARRDDSR